MQQVHPGDTCSNMHTLPDYPVAAGPLHTCLQESAPFMRVLGSYPMETDLGGLDSNTPFDSINE